MLSFILLHFIFFFIFLYNFIFDISCFHLCFHVYILLTSRNDTKEYAQFQEGFMMILCHKGFIRGVSSTFSTLFNCE